MKKKILIVACIAWFACALGGGLWGRFEHYLRIRSIPPGQLEVQNLKDLYDARLFDEVLKECDRATSNPQFADFAPQIIYVRWATDQQLGRTVDADETQKEFLQRFPNHILAAEMHFSTAMNFLASTEYGPAQDELALIQARYPTATTARKAGEILSRLCAATFANAVRTSDR